MPATKSVEVNFNITPVDASGNIVIFGLEPSVIENIVIADVTLPHNDLNGLLHFWEPSLARDTRLAKRNTDDWGNTQKNTLRSDLHSVINGRMDATNAKPFDSYAVANDDEHYYKYSNFGELALGSMAHYLLGHVAATVAISNDKAFVDYINGNTDSDAAIAKLLSDTINNINPTDALKIVEDVLKQDISRAMGADNTEYDPVAKQNLDWMTGDIIYLQVTLKRPTVTVSVGSSAQQRKPAAESVTEQQYNLKITLS